MDRQITLLQYFEWYLPADGRHWQRLRQDAPNLSAAGFTGVWLPPAYKGASGANDVGYGVYDLYDLGEFDQKGSVATKYGTKDEYLAAIDALHQNGLAVLADVVLNHRMGADYAEQVAAEVCDGSDRNTELSAPQTIKAWTGFRFPGRNGKYSGFCWDHTHFDGVDWNDQNKRQGIYEFVGKQWDQEVDGENGNYDYLMGADLDMGNPQVIQELDRWGEWYLNFSRVDGFRLDAVKHIRFTFFTHWLQRLRMLSNRPLWSVGEYWSQEVGDLTHYLDRCGQVMSLFDVPLHFNFMKASSCNGQFDMRRIFDGTLVRSRPDRAVTFVDNHDTQLGQALQSWVQGWFRPLAYALILLRQEGVPCVFYGDLYGIPHDGIDPVGSQLTTLLAARQRLAWGEQTDYFTDPNIIGWTRSGDRSHPGSGLAAVLSDSAGGSHFMCMGVGFSGMTCIDILGNHPGTVTLDSSGCGCFPVNGGSVSVWVPKEHAALLLP